MTKILNKLINKYSGKNFLHTSPHPDDVTLGYLPYINWLLNTSKNEHYFLTMTSGSNAVRDSDLIKFLELYKINKSSIDINQVNNIDFLKGLVREHEEESVWTSLGIPNKNIIHFRAKFYSQKLQDLSNDIEVLYKLLLDINPDILTVAIDPKGVGPETHYKTFLVVQGAVNNFFNKTGKNIEIIGYRNVWCQFEIEQVNLYFPVEQSDFDLLYKTFINSYLSQVDAMFPNNNYSGNFAEIAIAIMQDNLKKFINKFGLIIPESDPGSSNIKGLCFLKTMNIKEFLNLKL
ncbi:MAG: Glucosamine-6-phosphate deaminase-like protein [candidate division TM6 bacterium GW2011_GWF2_28_16]|nr:MAG: Glucosamine-6-phosphate deaminase-like protein [candidate division TM6 bacterium GW2011_GWF2_28_16]